MYRVRVYFAERIMNAGILEEYKKTMACFNALGRPRMGVCACSLIRQTRGSRLTLSLSALILIHTCASRIVPLTCVLESVRVDTCYRLTSVESLLC